MMTRILASEWTQSFMLALIILGVAALAYGAYRFVTVSQHIENSLVYQIQQGRVQSADSDSALLMAADLEMKALLRQRGEAAIFFGVGLILMASGWFGASALTNWKRLAQAAAGDSANRQGSS